jgi:ATP-dependent Clp protease adaptor protein ClpS
MAEPDSEKGTATTTAEPEEPKARPRKQAGTTTKPVPRRPPAKELPPYKVLLHNDDKNTFEHVILTLVELTPLDLDRAVQVTFEADKAGVALVLVTHKERAELYVDQFKSKSLTVTIEPAK